MKNVLLLHLLFILSANCYTQINYEQGYFIDNAGNRTDCLIKNVDWKNNPSEFEYKLNENSPAQKGGVRTVAEFSILTSAKYVRSKVNIDKSESQLKYLSKFKEPQFVEETLFLKELVKGKANLYAYESDNLNRFFFQTNSKEIQQLVYKKYAASDNRIGENTLFRQQLWKNLPCKDLSLDEVKYTDYNARELIAYFNKYNHCVDADYVGVKNDNEKRDWFNLGIKAGLNSSTLDINGTQIDVIDTDFGNDTNFRFGIEAEFLMPFNKNKWAIFIQPMYQSFKGEEELATQSVSVDYKSIEVSIGVRHYFFINDDSKIFLNSAIVLDSPLNSKIDFETSNDFDIESRNGVNFGLGYKFKNSYSLELNYTPRRELLGNFVQIESGYTVFSVVLGYTVF
ncbi:MAG: tRNA modification GTPase [Saonia sp.]